MNRFPIVWRNPREPRRSYRLHKTARFRDRAFYAVEVLGLSGQLPTWEIVGFMELLHGGRHQAPRASNTQYPQGTVSA
jgi:hypothetical protein